MKKNHFISQINNLQQFKDEQLTKQTEVKIEYFP
jgi:hypothetical protein